MTDGLPNQEVWTELARTKLIRVFGAGPAEGVYIRTLGRMNKEGLASADDLYRFSRELSRDPDPVAAAVGGLLGVTAILRGAEGDRSSPF